MKLHDTKWLADKLGISISTIEKLRAKDSIEIPIAIQINKTIRYSESYVEWWLEKKLKVTTLAFKPWLNELERQKSSTYKKPIIPITFKKKIKS